MSRGAFDRRGADGSIAVLDGTWVSAMLSKHPRDEILFGKGFLRRTDVCGTSVLLVANVGLGRFQRGYQALRLFNGNCFVSVAVKGLAREPRHLRGVGMDGEAGCGEQQQSAARRQEAVRVARAGDELAEQALLHPAVRPPSMAMFWPVM